MQWVAPFATRLDLDTLEDLVEGAGGFVTDRWMFLSTSHSLFVLLSVFVHVFPFLQQNPVVSFRVVVVATAKAEFVTPSGHES